MEQQMKYEAFQVIPDFPDYAVSQFGNVISLNYNRTGKIRLLKPHKKTDGYLAIGLFKNRKRCVKFIHRLVYETWIGEIPKGIQVNHIDENVVNNRLDNLNLMTPKENNNWGTRTQRCSKKVGQYTLDGELVKIWNSTAEAGRNGYNQGNISKCCRKIYKQAYGYVWRYV